MNKGLSKLGLDVHVFVFNNDVFEDCYGVVPYIKEPEVCYRSKPRIGLAISHRSISNVRILSELNGREYSLVLYDESMRKLYSVDGRLKHLSDPLLPEVVIDSRALPHKLPEARYARLVIGSIVEDLELPPQVRVYGRITDFYGRPRKGYVQLVSPYGFPVGGAIVRVGEDGRYELYAPKAIYHHAFICDGGYGRNTLEFYGWNVPIEPPEFRLDARFDKIEIYRLSAMETPERTLMIHFVAWDIAYTSGILKTIYESKGGIDIKDICGLDILTPLRKSDVEVYLGEQKLEVRTMRKIEYSIRDYGVKCLTKAYLLEAKIPSSLPRGKYPLRLVAHTVINGVKEWGEAVLYDIRII